MNSVTRAGHDRHLRAIDRRRQREFDLACGVKARLDLERSAPAGAEQFAELAGEEQAGRDIAPVAVVSLST